MTKHCRDAGQSRKQRVFARLEDESGILEFPIPTDAIRPAGDATLNQVPTYTDSKEKFDTLDLLDKFPNATPPGEWTVPMYVRLSGFSMPPQGEALFEAAMGKKGTDFSAVLTANVSASAMSIRLQNVEGDIAPVGVIKIGAETIRYGKYDSDTMTLSSCIRGYDGTVPDEHTSGDAVSMLSVVYMLDTCSPSFSLWIETDHLIQFMSGCAVDELKVPVQNEDGVLVTFSGKGMRMGWAGSTTMKAAVSPAETEITVNNAKRFSIGARVYNKTLNDFGTDGYEIVDIDHAAGILALAGGIIESWSVNDEIAGYLPPAMVSGDAVESRDTVFILGGMQGKVKKTELTIGVPKEFLNIEVGTLYPEEYVSTTRNISTNIDCVLRKSELDKFYEGYNGTETDEIITMGRTPGKKVSFVMPRVKPSVPTVQHDGAAVGLQIPATALGSVKGNQIGENSLYLVFE